MMHGQDDRIDSVCRTLRDLAVLSLQLLLACE